MDILIEKIIIYGGVGIFLMLVVLVYVRKLTRESKVVDEKIKIAIQEGLHEPISLHPVVDVNSCIKSGACVRVCPEQDILGIRNGKATVINASRCIGHGACFNACPTQAISLHMGTEKRGIDLPHVNQEFETNVNGIFIAGEMGGMGLIKNAVEQGKQAVGNICKGLPTLNNAEYDLVIIGAGPAGISASLEAKKRKLKTITLEQDSLGGTVFTFPRAKIVMTAPMDLPLFGKIKLYETSKQELLALWQSVITKNEIQIHQHKKVESIRSENGDFKVEVKDGTNYSTKHVLLAIGRRGTPRKLGVPGEDMPKVAYRLLEPELITDNNIVVVGGGDSAIESALLLADKNSVTLSYRKDNFSRLKAKNNALIQEAISDKKINVLLNSNLVSIEEIFVNVKTNENSEILILKNDLVYIFAGGELSTQFLKNCGVEMSKKFGEAILKH